MRDFKVKGAKEIEIRSQRLEVSRHFANGRQLLISKGQFVDGAQRAENANAIGARTFHPPQHCGGRAVRPPAERNKSRAPRTATAWAEVLMRSDITKSMSNPLGWPREGNGALGKRTSGP